MALTITEQPVWNFEQEPFVDERPDETSYNLRAYFDRMPDEKFRQYRPEWTDEQRAAGYRGWKKAVERTLNWVEVD